MTKKIPISFNEEDLKTIEELEKLLSLSNVYGSLPKVIKFSINLTLSTLKNPQKVYSNLNSDEMQYYFNALIKAEELFRIEEKREKATKDILFNKKV
jgi:hypothetical protein